MPTPMNGECHEKGCPVGLTVGLIGGKWKQIILWHLVKNTRRFGELRRLIPPITQKMLTQQLRELERDGLVHREVYAVSSAQGRVLPDAPRQDPGAPAQGPLALGLPPSAVAA